MRGISKRGSSSLPFRTKSDDRKMNQNRWIDLKDGKKFQDKRGWQSRNRSSDPVLLFALSSGMLVTAACDDDEEDLSDADRKQDEPRCSPEELGNYVSRRRRRRTKGEYGAISFDLLSIFSSSDLFTSRFLALSLVFGFPE